MDPRDRQERLGSTVDIFSFIKEAKKSSGSEDAEKCSAKERPKFALVAMSGKKAEDIRDYVVTMKTSVLPSLSDSDSEEENNVQDSGSGDAGEVRSFQARAVSDGFPTASKAKSCPRSGSEGVQPCAEWSEIQAPPKAKRDPTKKRVFSDSRGEISLRTSKKGSKKSPKRTSPREGTSPKGINFGLQDSRDEEVPGFGPGVSPVATAGVSPGMGTLTLDEEPDKRRATETETSNRGVKTSLSQRAGKRLSMLEPLRESIGDRKSPSAALSEFYGKGFPAKKSSRVTSPSSTQRAVSPLTKQRRKSFLSTRSQKPQRRHSLESSDGMSQLNKDVTKPAKRSCASPPSALETLKLPENRSSKKSFSSWVSKSSVKSMSTFAVEKNEVVRNMVDSGMAEDCKQVELYKRINILLRQKTPTYFGQDSLRKSFSVRSAFERHILPERGVAKRDSPPRLRDMSPIRVRHARNEMPAAVSKIDKLRRTKKKHTNHEFRGMSEKTLLPFLNSLGTLFGLQPLWESLPPLETEDGVSTEPAELACTPLPWGEIFYRYLEGSEQPLTDEYASHIMMGAEKVLVGLGKSKGCEATEWHRKELLALVNYIASTKVDVCNTLVGMKPHRNMVGRGTVCSFSSDQLSPEEMQRFIVRVSQMDPRSQTQITALFNESKRLVARMHQCRSGCLVLIDGDLLKERRLSLTRKQKEPVLWTSLQGTRMNSTGSALILPKRLAVGQNQELPLARHSVDGVVWNKDGSSPLEDTSGSPSTSNADHSSSSPLIPNIPKPIRQHCLSSPVPGENVEASNENSTPEISPREDRGAKSAEEEEKGLKEAGNLIYARFIRFLDGERMLVATNPILTERIEVPNRRVLLMPVPTIADAKPDESARALMADPFDALYANLIIHAKHELCALFVKFGVDEQVLRLSFSIAQTICDKSVQLPKLHVAKAHKFAECKNTMKEIIRTVRKGVQTNDPSGQSSAEFRVFEEVEVSVGTEILGWINGLSNTVSPVFVKGLTPRMDALYGNLRTWLWGQMEDVPNALTNVLNHIQERIELVVSGKFKQTLSNTWLYDIEDKVDEFLCHIGFDPKVLKMDYMNRMPSNLDSVLTNCKILKELLDPKSSLRHTFVPVVVRITTEIYEKVNELMEELVEVISLEISQDCSSLTCEQLLQIVKERRANYVKGVLGQPDQKMLEQLVLDLQYLRTMREMDDQNLARLQSVDAPMAKGLELSHVVPVSGLILARVHAFEADHKNVISLWFPGVQV